MEQRPDFTGAESHKDAIDDDDVEKSKDSKSARSVDRSKEKVKELGSIIAKEQRAVDKDTVVEKSKSLFGQVIEQTDTDDTPSETAAETIEAQLAPNEQRVAEQLAEGGEIYLHEEIAAIPSERDDLIVEEALEIAAEHDSTEPPVSETAPATEATENLSQERETDEDEVSAESAKPEVESKDDEAPAPLPITPPRSTTPGGGGSSRAGSGSGSGGGATPPPPPVYPAPPTGPAPALPRRPRFGAPLAAPETQNTVPELQAQAAVDRQVEDAEALGFRRGRNRGLVAGLLLGGGVEHIRHRRRERRMERQFAQERKEQEKKAENLRWDQIRGSESAKLLQAAAEKQRSIEQTRSTAQPEQARPVQLGTDEEQRNVAEKQRAALQAEQALQQNEKEQLDVAEGHHIERSAWHNIEVDKQGHAVQEASFEYGHEYYKERAKETGPKHKQQFDEAAGEVALVAAALSDSQPGNTGAQGSPRTESAQPSHMQSGYRSPKDTSMLKKLTTPPTTARGTAGWSLALLIIVVVFVLLTR